MTRTSRRRAWDFAESQKPKGNPLEAYDKNEKEKRSGFWKKAKAKNEKEIGVLKDK